MSLSKEMIADLKVADEIREMMRHPGWEQYTRLLRLKLEERTTLALLPLVAEADGDGVKHVLVGEANKGAIIGIRLALELPSMIVAGAESVRQRNKPSTEK